MTVAAKITPRASGTDTPPPQRRSGSVSGSSASAAYEPRPPAAVTVPVNSSTPATTITSPCTASVFTTEMNPPTTVYSMTMKKTMMIAVRYGMSRNTSSRFPIPLNTAVM